VVWSTKDWVGLIDLWIKSLSGLEKKNFGLIKGKDFLVG
jgi:hypothetical protein